jgi:hypothetical protein
VYICLDPEHKKVVRNFLHYARTKLRYITILLICRLSIN